jgi:hypothetical protein
LRNNVSPSLQIKAQIIVQSTRQTFPTAPAKLIVVDSFYFNQTNKRAKCFELFFVEADSVPRVICAKVSGPLLRKCVEEKELKAIKGL